MIDLDRPSAARASGVVVDVMYGPARGYLDRLLEEAGCDVTLLHGTRDVMFGNHPPEPAEEHLGELIRTVRDREAHLGLATDGDADRFGVVDRDGTVLAPNPILALVLRHLLAHRGWRGGVGRSVATTHLLDALARPPRGRAPRDPRRVQVPRRPDHARARHVRRRGVRRHEPPGPSAREGRHPRVLPGGGGRRGGGGWRWAPCWSGSTARWGASCPIRVNVPLSGRRAARAAGADRRAAPRRSGRGAVKRVQTTDGLKLHLDGGAWVLVRPRAPSRWRGSTWRRPTPRTLGCPARRCAPALLLMSAGRDHSRRSASPRRAPRGAGLAASRRRGRAADSRGTGAAARWARRQGGSAGRPRRPGRAGRSRRPSSGAAGRSWRPRSRPSTCASRAVSAWTSARPRASSPIACSVGARARVHAIGRRARAAPLRVSARIRAVVVWEGVNARHLGARAGSPIARPSPRSTCLSSLSTKVLPAGGRRAWPTRRRSWPW